MTDYRDRILASLAGGPLAARQLIEKTGVSQSTVSRALKAMGADIVRLGVARSSHYALRDGRRGLPDLSVYRVDAEGRLCRLGTLLPVRPEGFVMRQEDGVWHYSEGLPWWLVDMRPQGYLGRAFVRRYATRLGLPEQLGAWSDTDALRALLAQGEDVVGNLLLGEVARARFLDTPVPEPVALENKALAYARLALEAARGELPGSSAGGEQPKFIAYAQTGEGPRQVIVKFTEAEDSPVSERWRDLLLAEHLALEVLRAADVPAARTRILDHAGQRFLEVERFDRVGALGRRGLFSLAALEAEFVGAADRDWPTLVRGLAEARAIRPEAVELTALLWAYGALLGNTDMHAGNLSFISEHGRPYMLAPAYDMSPMAFAPRSGGGLPDSLPAVRLLASVSPALWRRAVALVHVLLARMAADARFSARFVPCLAALRAHLAEAEARLARLA